MTPAVSVLIPVYNVEKYLNRCLSSVLEQSLTNIEIVCVNDGSTDRSLSILQQIAQSDPRVRVLTKANHGLAAVRNRLLQETRGEYFFFLDSDDWLLHPQALQHLYDRARQTQADVVQGWYKEYDENTHTTIGCDKLYGLYHGPKPPRSDKDRFAAARAYLQVWGRLARTKLVQENQIMCPPSGLVEDAYFSILLFAYAKRIEFLEEYLLVYVRSNPTSLSQNVRKMHFAIQKRWGELLQELANRQYPGHAFYDGLIHALLRSCKGSKWGSSQEEQQIRQIPSCVARYAPLCSWFKKWKYSLFARLAKNKPTKTIIFYAGLLR